MPGRFGSRQVSDITRAVEDLGTERSISA